MANTLSVTADDEFDDFDDYEWQLAQFELFGEISNETRRRVSQLSTAYDLILRAYTDGGGKHDDDAFFKIVPARVFELAASLKWIPYFLEVESPDNPDFSFPVIETCCHVLPTSGWLVERDTWIAFMRLLPIEQNADVYPSDPLGVVGLEWKLPTPKELVEGFVNKRVKGRPRRTKTWLAIQMLTTEGYDVGEDAARQFLKLRCVEPEIKQDQKSTIRGRKQAGVLMTIFKRHEPNEYVDLKPSDFFWSVAR